MKKAHKWTYQRRAARLQAKEDNDARKLMARIVAFDPVLRAAFGIKCKNWLDNLANFRKAKAQFVYSYGELTYGEYHAMLAALKGDVMSRDLRHHLDLTERTHRLIESARYRRKVVNLMPVSGLNGWQVVDLEAGPDFSPYQKLAILPITFDVLQQQANHSLPC